MEAAGSVLESKHLPAKDRIEVAVQVRGADLQSLPRTIVCHVLKTLM
jgi:hypothetical protein